MATIHPESFETEAATIEVKHEPVYNVENTNTFITQK
jgi:hypothetical protein